MSASTEKKMRQAAREAGTDKKKIKAEAEAKAQAQSKRRWTLGTVAIVLLIAVILLLNSGLIYQLPAYTANGESFSAAKMNYHFGAQYNYMLNQYGNYISMFGLDPSSGIKGLANQDCPMSDGSWRDYFIEAAENEVLQTKIFADYAKANGISLDESDLAAVDSNFDGLDALAKSQGYSSADNFFAANYGEGVNLSLVRKAYQDSALANKGLTALSETFQYDSAELKAKYDSYNGEQDYYDFIYYFVAAETVKTTAEDGTETSEATDETRAEAKAKAEAIVANFKAAEGDDLNARMSEAVSSVIDGANAYSQTNVLGGNLGDYKAWLTNSARQHGDVTTVDNNAGTGTYVVVFVSHNDNDYNLRSVRHILVKAEADENGVYTDAAKAEAKAKAEAILAEFGAGDKSEESFAALAVEKSEDAGSAANGGLYENIARGQMVKEFNDFCFGIHKHGDTDIVYGESASYAGYHVMYFVGDGQNCREYIAQNDLRNTAVSEWLTEQMDAAVTSEGFGMKFVG